MRTSNALLAFLRHAHSCLLQQAGEFTEEKWIQKPDEHIDAAAASSLVYSSRLPVSARQTSADLSRSLLHLRDPALERARLQSAAVSEIAGTSGCPVYDYALPVPQWCVDVFGPHLFGTVTSLSWFEWGVFPPDSVENHRNYAAVGKLPALTTITIFDSAFPIDVLPRCRALKRLEIIRNGLRDADMTIICRLSGLQSLSLAENDITAVGVEQLSRLQNLRELDLSGNLISPEALTLLQKRLPQCQITCTWSRISECGSNSTAQHTTVEHSTGRHDAD